MARVRRTLRSLAAPRRASAGWEATELSDQRVVERRYYADWHRVERAIALFARKIEELGQGGWCQA